MCFCFKNFFGVNDDLVKHFIIHSSVFAKLIKVQKQEVECLLSSNDTIVSVLNKIKFILVAF